MYRFKNCHERESEYSKYIHIEYKKSNFRGKNKIRLFFFFGF